MFGELRDVTCLLSLRMTWTVFQPWFLVRFQKKKTYMNSKKHWHCVYVHLHRLTVHFLLYKKTVWCWVTGIRGSEDKVGRTSMHIYRCIYLCTITLVLLSAALYRTTVTGVNYGLPSCCALAPLNSAGRCEWEDSYCSYRWTKYSCKKWKVCSWSQKISLQLGSVVFFVCLLCFFWQFIFFLEKNLCTFFTF